MGDSGLAQAQVDLLNARAKQQYPFLNNTPYNISYTGPKGRDGAYLEAWQVGDVGDPSWKRDPRLPVNKAGIELFRADVTPTDIAADMLSHTDPKGQIANAKLLSTLQPGQIEELKHESGDYHMSKNMGMSEKAALKNAGSSLYRAGVFNQWGQDGLAHMGLTPEQKNIIDNSKYYATTGKDNKGKLVDIRTVLGIGGK